MKHVALLEGVEQIYRGVETIEDSALTEAHVEVPADCDLAPGKYRWTGSAFAPLAGTAQRPAAGVPLDVAFYGLVEQLTAAGVDVGPVARSWARQFEQTVDAMKTALGGNSK